MSRCRVPALSLLILNTAWAQPTGWRSYVRNLHSHTAVSDGFERPTRAFLYARDTAKVDFLCLSEHNHSIGTNTTQEGLDELAQAASAMTTAGFIALTGQEFSTIKNGNHVNVYDVGTQIPRALLNDYRTLFTDWLPAYQQAHPDRVVVAQFNHPESHAKDYGRISYTVQRDGQTRTFKNFDGDEPGFRDAADNWVRTIAILSGPADATNKDGTTTNEHADIDPNRVRIWQRYLDLGLHLGPVADQDNHSRTWGNRTHARTGVWVQGPLTKQSLLRALQANRTYASEDRNLTVWYTINGQPMGSRIADTGDQDLTISVNITDADEPTATYVVRLLRETIGDDDLPVEIDKIETALRNNQPWESTVEHLKGDHEAYLVQVTQTGTNGTIDVAWTAPIWIEPPPATELDETEGFVKSRSSNVYHYPACPIAVAIKARGNLVSHTPQPGDGTRLHKHCPTNQ